LPPLNPQANKISTNTNNPKPDVLLAKPPWSHTHPHLSHTIFVSVPLPLARTRLVARHLASGLASTPAEADRRAVDNDLPNGDDVVKLRMEAVDDVVESFEDKGWWLN
jgi:pantothenate kinase